MLSFYMFFFLRPLFPALNGIICFRKEQNNGIANNRK